VEVEIQRKKEHQNFATNFEKARGFVRQNWKSKKSDYRTMKTITMKKKKIKLRNLFKSNTEGGMMRRMNM
jgi:nuclear transport factor 2 (NTF2) superfamily protein